MDLREAVCFNTEQSSAPQTVKLLVPEGEASQTLPCDTLDLRDIRWYFRRKGGIQGQTSLGNAGLPKSKEVSSL